MLVSGKDGELFIYGNGVLFAQAERFTVHTNEQRTAFAPIGGEPAEVTTGVQVFLTLNEVTILDETTATKLLRDIQRGAMPQFDFQGKMKRYDGFAERLIARNITPDGDVDIVGLARGYVDAWAFRANATPELLKQLENGA